MVAGTVVPTPSAAQETVIAAAAVTGTVSLATATGALDRIQPGVTATGSVVGTASAARRKAKPRVDGTAAPLAATTVLGTVPLTRTPGTVERRVATTCVVRRKVVRRKVVARKGYTPAVIAAG